jgi:tRNA pseudouridine38-40 synthase
MKLLNLPCTIIFFNLRSILEQRYFMELSFRGTAYNGWQVQPNALGVQQVVEEGLRLLLKEDIRLTGAGRTDTGVHASCFVAHFDLTATKILQPGITEHRLNHILPADIAVSSVFPVNPGDHSRYSAISRTYKYYVSLRKDPFRLETSNHIHFRPDIGLMNKAARLLLDYDDFSSFCRSNSGAKNHICRVTEAKWEEHEGLLVFTISADRFLRNMVRAITGTILDTGSGKLAVEGFREIIEARDRRRAGTSAPARGLFLTAIEYPPRIMALKHEFYR